MTAHIPNPTSAARSHGGLLLLLCALIHLISARTAQASDQLGVAPRAALIRGSDGALYGTTHWGGNGAGGTVFTVKSNGTSYRVLHHFSTSASDSDGKFAFAGVVEGSDGMLYGVTESG